MKKERRIIGKCIACHNLVYEDHQWEVFDTSLPIKVSLGPIHKRCRVKHLRFLIKELSREVASLERIILKNQFTK